MNKTEVALKWYKQQCQTKQSGLPLAASEKEVRSTTDGLGGLAAAGPRTLKSGNSFFKGLLGRLDPAVLDDRCSDLSFPS